MSTTARDRRRQRWLLRAPLIAVVVGAAVTGGCSSDDAQPEKTTTTVDGAAFIAAAEEICAEAFAVDPLPPPQNAEETAAALEATAETTLAAVDALRELRAPDQQTFERWLDGTQSAAEQVEVAAAYLRDGDAGIAREELAEAEATSASVAPLVQELGIEGCGPATADDPSPTTAEPAESSSTTTGG